MTIREVKEQLAVELREQWKREASGSHEPLLANALLRDAVRERATDVHIEPQGARTAAIRLRVDGALLDAAMLPTDAAEQLGNQLKVLAGLDPFPAGRPQSARWTTLVDDREVDIRMSALSSLAGERITLRLLDREQTEAYADQVALDSNLLDRVARREGMLLVVGPTGCGKTTTIYKLIQHLSHEPCSVMTVEDPPEFQVPGVTQFPVGDDHGATIPEGIRTALRMDPDYLLVGEVRDEPSARAATDAASTGCVLFGTLHARDAVGAVTSLRKWNVDNFELSTLLSAVVAQRLVRRLCPKCRRQAPLDSNERSWFEMLGMRAPESAYRATGCSHCNQIGYHGRVAVFETWLIEEGDRRQLLNNVDERALRRDLATAGHRFLLSDALAKVESGETDVSEVRSMGGFGPSLAAIQSPASKSE